MFLPEAARDGTATTGRVTRLPGAIFFVFDRLARSNVVSCRDTPGGFLAGSSIRAIEVIPLS